MCSIFGILDIKEHPEALRRTALEMSRRQLHRGPDWEGIYQGEKAIVVHERLSIVDPSNGAQPLYNDNRTHVLAANGEIYNQETFEKWYSRTLSFVQGKKISWREVREFLLQVECVKETDDFSCLTDLGEISFRFYYPPDRIYWLKDKLRLIVNSGIIKEPEAISWLLAYQHCSIGEAKADELSEYKSAVNSLGLYFHCGELTEGYAYYCMLSRRKPKWLKHKIEELKKDIERLFGALQQIARVEEIPVSNTLEVWLQCVKRKLPYELGELSLEFPDATVAQLFELDSISVHRKRDLIKNKHKVECYCSESLRKYLNGISL